jgi:hypothetical protein
LFFRSVRINILPVQPNKLETLDDLLAPAEHYAGFCMRNSGKMSPTLFLIGADGPLMFVPASLVDANEKDDFATTARLVCIAHAATVSVMALEAWMKSATPGVKMDMTEPPSEAFDRQEVIVLMTGDSKPTTRPRQRRNIPLQHKRVAQTKIGTDVDWEGEPTQA